MKVQLQAKLKMVPAANQGFVNIARRSADPISKQRNRLANLSSKSAERIRPGLIEQSEALRSTIASARAGA